MAKPATVAAHVADVPPPMLLALVAQFLENNGFKSSHRIYNTERKKRPEKEGWEGTLAKSYTAKVPSLESIFQIWEKEHWKVGNGESESDSERSLSSSEDSSESDASGVSSESEDISSSDDESQAGTVSSSDSDHEVSDEVPAGLLAPASVKSLKRKAIETQSQSSNSSNSSDSSSENDSKSAPESGPPVKKQRVNYTSSTSNSDSNSDSESDAESKASSVSKAFTTATNNRLPSSPDESSSDDSSDTESSSDESDKGVAELDLDKASSDSSGTIVGDIKTSQSLSELSPNEEAVAVTQATTTKRHHGGAHPTRLAQISAAANDNDYVSNDYISYDYADKAYRDLSITRGKGFTKEKNKKKRGSYRGGAIDISGGKGFKFDD